MYTTRDSCDSVCNKGLVEELESLLRLLILNDFAVHGVVVPLQMIHDAIRETVSDPNFPKNCDNYDYRKDPNYRPPFPDESTSLKNEQQSLWNRVMQFVGRGDKGKGPPNSKGPGDKQNSSPSSEHVDIGGSSYQIQLDSNAQSPQASLARDQFLLSLVQCFARELPGQVVSLNLQVARIPQRKCLQPRGCF